MYGRGIHLENNKCKLQTMDELLCNMPAREIKDEEFLKVKSEYSSCLILLWIEEKFNIISGNYYDWEEEIKENYNFFHTIFSFFFKIHSLKIFLKLMMT